MYIKFLGKIILKVILKTTEWGQMCFRGGENTYAGPYLAFLLLF